LTRLVPLKLVKLGVERRAGNVVHVIAESLLRDANKHLEL
jgi:hypothetical protein